MFLNETQRFLLQNVSIIALGLFIIQMVQTAGSIVLARVLNDPVAFGEVNLLLQIFFMVTLFLNVGFTSALVYTFSREPEAAIERKYRFALTGSLSFGIVIAILLCLLAPVFAQAYHLPSLKGALRLSAVILVCNSIVNMGVASFSGNREFGTQSFFMVITTTFSTAGTVLGVICPFRGLNLLENISLWMGIGSILTATFICWKVQRVHKPRWFGALSLREMRGMMAYGVPIWAGNIAKAFQAPFLVMMIGSSSVVAVGYLANGMRITGFIGIITWAFMIVTFPFVAESAQDEAESRRRGTLCIRYNNILLYPLTSLICIFPDQINGFLFGRSYTSAESATYIRLLALGVFFSAVGRLGGSILAGAGKTKANFWVMVVAGIVVVSIVPFVVAGSPVAAVWIYTLGWALSAVSMIGFFYLEHFRLDWWKAYGEPLVPTVAMVALMEVGRLAGAFQSVFIVAGLLIMFLLTCALEVKPLDTERLRIRIGRR